MLLYHTYSRSPHSHSFCVVLLATAVSALSPCKAIAQGPREIPAAQFEFFEKKVRPLLEQRCLECHSSQSDPIGGSLRLDSRSGWARGGDLGPAIVPGRPDQSLLMQAVAHTHAELEMPPDGKLTRREIRVLDDWIKAGAYDPRDDDATEQLAADQDDGRDHWAFQSPHGRSHQLPSVRNKDWPTNAVDLFILAELEREGLQPAPQADQRTLLRRATFDLTGLPPSPAEVDAFLQDEAPDAYAKLIDRLLASPRHGERWGRYWLDVARYADSNGLDENVAYGNAWRFRDYVIESINDDKPFDSFVREQLAGDLLPKSARAEIDRQRTIATGFLSLGPKVLAEVDEAKMEMDIIDEQVETVGRAFMGLTIGCARCHDHKFDPISTEDYYGLAGIFKSTRTMEHFTKIARWNEVNIADPELRAKHATVSERIQELERQIETIRSESKEKDAEQCDSAESAGTQRRLDALNAAMRRWKRDLPELPYAMAVTDYDQATDLRVHVRGSVLSQADVVPRRFPKVLARQEVTSAPHIGSLTSGRVELADWLVDGRHPLTARVMVNRLWRWHFGRGLVESTDNFGRLGEIPVNQPLLDWLADRLVTGQWSLKRMHRLIMQSSTYRMSAQGDSANTSKDAQNRYQWRASVRRLEAEAIRDAVLHTSGLLDLEMGGSLLHVKNREFLFDHTSKDQTKYDSVRRSVYLPVIRNHLYDGFQLFDYADASVMSGDRTTTTVATQALFMMNSKLVAEAASAFAGRVRRRHEAEEERITYAYNLAFARLPSASQLQRAIQYLEKFRRETGGAGENGRHAELKSWSRFCQALLMSNEFVHVH